MVLSAPMIDLPGTPTSFLPRALLRILRLAGHGGRYIPGGGDELIGTESFVNNPLTTDPVRYARNAAILKENSTLGIGSPTVAWADTASGNGFSRRHLPVEIRQPILMLAASSDTVVSTSAIEEFAYHLRAGSHLVIAGSKHEILQEQDRYRAQFWAAFDAFVPGTPLFGGRVMFGIHEFWLFFVSGLCSTSRPGPIPPISSAAACNWGGAAALSPLSESARLSGPRVAVASGCRRCWRLRNSLSRSSNGRARPISATSA